jgi:hypothetical protein
VRHWGDGVTDAAAKRGGFDGMDTILMNWCGSRRSFARGPGARIRIGRRVSVSLVFALCVLGGANLACSRTEVKSQGSHSNASPAAELPPFRPGAQGKARPKYAGFVSSWNKAVEQGAVDDFIALMTSAAGKERVSSWDAIWEGATSKKTFYISDPELFHVFAWQNAQPWVTVIDYVAPTYPTTPGGAVNIGMYEAFTTPTSALTSGNPPPTPRLHTFKTTPAWPNGKALGGMGLKRGGGTGSLSLVDREKGIALIAIVPRYWLTVPRDTTVKTIPLALEAMAEGPRGGAQSVTAPVKESFTLDVFKAPTPSREQLLALWACALELGEQLTEFEVKDKTQAELGVLSVLDATLRQGAGSGAPLYRSLASQLIAHPLYVKNVLAHLGNLGAVGHN